MPIEQRLRNHDIQQVSSPELPYFLIQVDIRFCMSITCKAVPSVILKGLPIAVTAHGSNRGPRIPFNRSFLEKVVVLSRIFP